jgi:hypothetical protein
MSWLDTMFQITTTIYSAGSLVASRAKVNFVSGATAVDNPGQGRVDVTITAGASPAGSNGDLQMKSGTALAAAHLNDNGTTVVASLPVAFGAGAAASQGAHRFDSNAAQAGAWYGFGGSDYPIWTTDSSGNLYLGGSSAWASFAPTLNVSGYSYVSINVGSTAYFIVGAGLCQAWQPLKVFDSAAPATPTGGGVLFSVGGAPNWIDTTGHVHQLSDVSECLAVDFTTASTVAVNTNLAMNLGAADVWIVDFCLFVSLASGTAGIKVAVTTPAGATLRGVDEGMLTTLSTISWSSYTAGAGLLGPFNTIAGVAGCVKGTMRVKGGGTAGALTIQVASGAAVNATVYAGSWLRARRAVEV